MPPILLDGRAAPVSHVAPPPAPPPPHTVKPSETLDSIARSHNVSTQELATANRIPPNAKIEPGQILQLPVNAKLSAEEQHQDAPQTPQEKTDAAYNQYLQAQYTLNADKRSPAGRADAGDDQRTLSQARSAFDKAVQDEVAGKVAQTNQGVPPEYATPESRLIKQYGDQIAQRYAGDSAGTSEIRSAVADYQLKRTADGLIPDYGGQWTAAEKLDGIDLKGQPQAVIDKVMADPRVQQWIKDAAHEATTRPTKDDVQSLVDLSRTSPLLASKVIQQWWDSQETQSIMVTNGAATLCASDPDMYANMATLYNALAGTPGGEQVQQQIASTIANQQQDNPTFLQHTLNQALMNGADPKLAIAVAGQMETNGKHDASLETIGTVKASVFGFQKVTLKNDMEAYARQTEELNKLITDLGPGLTDTQKQKAIDAYVKGKGTDWQNQLKAEKNKIIADVRSLDVDMSALKTENMPDNLKKLGITDQGFQQLADDDTTRKAVQFAAEQDPGIFESKEGGDAAKLWVEIGHKDKDFTAAVGKAYVSGHVLPALSDLNPNDAASVAKARASLEDFRGTASKMLGIPQKEVDEGINKLDEVLGSLKSESIDDAMQGKGINALSATVKKLDELKELPFTDKGAGLAFRSLAFGITGIAFINQTGKTIDDPTTQNILGTVAFGLDLAPSKNALTGTIKMLDKNDVLERWGVGAAGLTEKFIGVLNIAYFAAGAISGVEKGDYPTAIFSGIGAGGAALATFGGDEAIGGLAGPVGIAIATVATVALGLIEHHNEEKEYKEAENKFLEGAGIEESQVRDGLIGAGGDQLNAMRARGIAPEDIQEIAKTNPEAMHIAYGNDAQGRPY